LARAAFLAQRRRRTVHDASSSFCSYGKNPKRVTYFTTQRNVGCGLSKSAMQIARHEPGSAGVSPASVGDADEWLALARSRGRRDASVPGNTVHGPNARDSFH
jgi:hypothetical protein